MAVFLLNLFVVQDTQFLNPPAKVSVVYYKRDFKCRVLQKNFKYFNITP